tara:strand:- start:254 stop:763 length:510 start_codon:yes stop_codon:yes gene_type:complete
VSAQHKSGLTTDKEITKYGISLYVPLHTKHWVGGDYASGEGGNIGLIATKTYKSQVFTLGVLRNSFGKTSFMIGYGLTKNFNKINLSFSGGFASGYKPFIKRIETIHEIIYGETVVVNYYKAITPRSIFKGSGIVPYIIATIKIPIYKNVGLQVNLSPIYVNSGIYINL